MTRKKYCFTLCLKPILAACNVRCSLSVSSSRHLFCNRVAVIVEEYFIERSSVRGSWR